MNSYIAGDSRHDQSESLDELRARLEMESGDSLELVRDIENNPICSVSVDQNVPCIVVVWRRYATSVQLRFIHEVIIELLKEHRLSKVLGDDTNLPTIHREDQSWIVNNWMPRAIAAGLKVASNKAPLAFFGRMAVSTVQSDAPEGLITRSFEDFKDAREWLQELSVF